tara:strand:+ start:1422 stop:1853 length:432 start_codon:yes stop_codon:yes gene_type:complete
VLKAIMSKLTLDYSEQRRFSPMTYWVHRGVNESDTYYEHCSAFEPPLPNKDPLKGYPYLTVSVLGFHIEFSSSNEMEHFIEVMEQKNLPTTISLSKQRGSQNGPNSHWLSRFPAHLKKWEKREKLVLAVKKAKESAEVSGNGF